MNKVSKKTSESENKLSRRRFVAEAGMATASWMMLQPALVRGTQANARIKTGVIGLGGRGAWIARHLREHGGYEITAVADYFDEVVQEVGAELGVAQERRFSGLNGYKRLVDSQVEAVFCETPPYCFPDHVAEAVTAGCHVYVAKPLGCDVPGCLKIAAAAKQATANKQVFLCDFQTRTNEYYIEAVKRVQRGDIGAFTLLDVPGGSNGFKDPPLTDTIESRLRHLVWVNDVALGGGLNVNFDIHAVDVALWIAGKRPVSAMGCARRADTTAHGDAMRVFSLTYQFDGGLVLNQRTDHLQNLTSDIVCNAYGDKGYLESKYNGKVWIQSHKEPYRGGETGGIYQKGMQANVATFHRSVTQKNYDNPTVEPSINSTLATILGREAGRRNTELTWDAMIKENRRWEPNLRGLKA